MNFILNKLKLTNFKTKIKNDFFIKGLNINIIENIVKKRNEPKWMLDFRLKSYNCWVKMKEPHWSNISYHNLNYQDYCYYSAPYKIKSNNKNIKDSFNKLGINLSNKFNKNKIAIDAVFDSISIKTTYQKYLKKLGIIFCSINEAIIKFPNIIKSYLGTVVKFNDNYFAALNSAVFSDGTFIYIPNNISCPIDLFTYFRINNPTIGQFERTLIIVENNSKLNYIEGCSAPIYKKYQLHAAVVEIIINNNSKVKYSTLQNWAVNEKNKKNGILNFVTKRALCKGNNSKMSWIQLELGAAITWKYPSVILKGNNSKGNFYSITLTDNLQQADTGTKMIHIGKNTKSFILSKSIVAGNSNNIYRSIVNITNNAINSTNYTQCDTLIINKTAKSYTFPHIKINNNSSDVAHEAYINKIRKDQLLFCLQRGLSKEKSIYLLINGLCKDIFIKMPNEFYIEAEILLTNIIKQIINFKKKN